MSLFAPQRRWYHDKVTGLSTIRRHPEALSRYQMPESLKHERMAEIDNDGNVSCPTCGSTLIGEDDD